MFKSIFGNVYSVITRYWFEMLVSKLIAIIYMMIRNELWDGGCVTRSHELWGKDSIVWYSPPGKIYTCGMYRDHDSTPEPFQGFSLVLISSLNKLLYLYVCTPDLELDMTCWNAWAILEVTVSSAGMFPCVVYRFLWLLSLIVNIFIVVIDSVLFHCHLFLADHLKKKAIYPVYCSDASVIFFQTLFNCSYF